MVTLKGACQQRERHSKFLSYLTGARYVHPWWRGRCQSCNQVPATQCNVCDRNLITGLTSTASPRVDIPSTCKLGQKLGVSLSPSVDMLPFGVNIPATVPQRSEIPEGLMITLYLMYNRITWAKISNRHKIWKSWQKYALLSCYWSCKSVFGSHDSPLHANMHLLVLKTSVFQVCT